MVAEMTFQEAPLLQQILLEEPWAAIGVLAILRLVLLILARHQQKRRRFLVRGCCPRAGPVCLGRQ